MCGIAGILRFDGRPVDEAFIRGVAEGLAHRGRDSQGVMFGSAILTGEMALSRTAEIALAHRRLSIIDLNQESAQPMSYADGRLWIVFNGEIYNYIELREELVQRGHRFRTRSDTEVILASYDEWGEECIKKFNGMFAFALWDERERRLFCARDHVGIKPFYFHYGNGFFAFASEAKPLAKALGKALDSDGVLSYLLCMYVAGNKSIFEGVEKLPPASAMTIAADGIHRVWRYWSLERLAIRALTPDSERELAKTIEDAVALQLRSDVPVGALLSGGVDSTLVTAMAARKISSLHTFTIGYEGMEVDERAHARNIARRYGTVHHEYLVTKGEVMEEVVASQRVSDAPIADTAMAASHILCGIAAGEGVKVLLGGTGGDEAFGGYTRFLNKGLGGLAMAYSPRWLRRLAGDAVYPFDAGTGMRIASNAINQIVRAGGCARLCARAAAPRGGLRQFAARMVDTHLPAMPAAMELKYWNMLFDLSVYLPDELLVLLDQMAMAWTIEGRVPLLDVNVIEAAYALPPSAHIRNTETKILLRRLSVPFIGKEIAYQPKQGFGGPVALWVDTHQEEMFERLPVIQSIPLLERFDISTYTARRGETFSAAEAAEIYRLFCLAVWYENLA